jgi:hypothetical protein
MRPATAVGVFPFAIFRGGYAMSIREILAVIFKEHQAIKKVTHFYLQFS